MKTFIGNFRDRVRAHATLIQRLGLFTYIRGVIKRKKYLQLQAKFRFDKWHVIPCELRPYAIFLIHYINNVIKPDKVIEYGCGLGDILRNVNAKEKYGLDASEEVIRAAQFIDKDNTCTFQTGYLGECKDNFPQELDLLITVNFIHNISEMDLRAYYSNMLSKMSVKKIIVDGYGGAYKYHHYNWEEIIPGYRKEVIYKIDEFTFYLLEKERG